MATSRRGDAGSVRDEARIARQKSKRSARGADHDTAMARVGRLLALRPRSEVEIRRRLAEWGCEPETAEGVVRRLYELRLLDDADFARRWVEERSRRGLAGAALVAELRARGVSREAAEAAVAGAGLDETAQARVLAARYLPRVADLPLRQQAARIQAMLTRRGYSPEAGAEAARAVLPPEGWD
jgi:regulatory protein